MELNVASLPQIEMNCILLKGPLENSVGGIYILDII
jgi:hypothetical protein